MSITQTAEIIQRIASLEAEVKRIPELESQVSNLQRQIVETCATQIQSVLSHPVMRDTLAAQVLVAAANALAFKAGASKERAPELTVIEGYVPGALRAILAEDGSISIDQQLKDAKNAGASWESCTAEYEERGILETFNQLLAAYGATAGRVYYITDSVTLQTHREKIAKELAATAGPAQGEDTPEAAAVQAEVEYLVHDEEGQFENGLIIPRSAQLLVTRDDVEAHVYPEQLEVGDAFTYRPDHSDVVYQGTLKSVEQLTAEHAEPAPEAPADDASDEGVAMVRLTTRGVPLGGEGAEGEELPSIEVLADKVYDVVVAGEGTVQKKASELVNGDVIAVSRNQQVLREFVVAVNPVVADGLVEA